MEAQSAARETETKNNRKKNYLYPTRAVCSSPYSSMFISKELIIMFATSQKSTCKVFMEQYLE